MPKISVIVPVYNVEQYLAACVQSVLAQTYRDFELILVDDGSPDRCGALCDGYALQDGRVRVVHKKNGGLSSARNAGLDVMQGQYVTFIDSDDVVHPQYLEILLGLLERENADISMCYYDFFSTEGDWYSEHTDLKDISGEMLWTDELLADFIDHCRKVSLVSQCMKLYKSQIFSDFRMHEGYTQEDSMALPFVLERAKSIVRCRDKLYHWRWTPGSITRSSFSKRDFDMIEVYYCWTQFFTSRKSKQTKYFKRDFLRKTLYYYYKIQDEKPELMTDFSVHMKRYRKLLPKYIWVRKMPLREWAAYATFFFSPKAARKNYMRVYGDVGS